MADPSNTPDSFLVGDSSATSLDNLQTSDDHSSPSSTPGNHSSGMLFFADATLDLSEAHDMAETPEPCRMILSEQAVVTPRGGGLMEMPILETPDTTSAQETPAKKNTTSLSNTTTRPTTNMNRITSDDLPLDNTFPPLHPPRRVPRRPRDIPWAVSWVLVVPVSMLITSFFSREYSKFTRGAQGSVFYSILLAYGATVVLGRLLYRTSGGGDGDDARHYATHVLLMFSPISVAVYLLLTILIITKTPNAMLYAILPGTCLVKSGLALRKWRSHQLFFQALVCMSLDITSRSLRRSSFYRMVSGIMGVQLCMVVWWKLSLFGAISHSGGVFWILLSLFAGKWLTGTVARTLNFIASGGIANWFIQQSIGMQEQVEQQKGEDSSDASADYNVGYSTATMTEEYRTADASIYQSVLDMDEGIDDDYVDDDDDAVQSGNSAVEQWTGAGSSTCKSLLIAAVTTCFGSVAQCGLLGGLAQFIWSVVRKADALLQHQGFSRMQIGQDGRVSVSVLVKIVTQANVIARTFVKRHSDLAMCHVAAYYKSYQKAACDVMMLVDVSGTCVCWTRVLFEGL